MYRIRLDLGKKKKKKVKSPLICEESDWMLVRGEIISKTRANGPVTSSQSLLTLLADVYPQHTYPIQGLS